MVSTSNFCFVCGKFVDNWIESNIISDSLASIWQLTPIQRKQFNKRESSFCPFCNNSLRTRALAVAIMKTYPFPNCRFFSDWVKMANKKRLKVAEINSCGKLHPYLKKLRHLSYSEYNLNRVNLGLFKRVTTPRHEDITKLSYKDNTFDLVLHSEVLEHVPGYQKALEECRRILKPNGICLFTVPLIPKRKTRTCASLNNETGETKHLKQPSYHGSGEKNDFLVWWEFGGDLIKKESLKPAFSDTKNLAFVYKFGK